MKHCCGNVGKYVEMDWEECFISAEIDALVIDWKWNDNAFLSSNENVVFIE